jgi:hypothetical protein
VVVRSTGTDSVLATIPGPDRQAAAAPDVDVLRAAPLVVSALFERCPIDSHGFQVELRQRLGSHPPAAILWRAEVPLVLLLEEVLFMNRTIPRQLRERLIAEGRAQEVAVQQVRERQLWLLVPLPWD